MVGEPFRSPFSGIQTISSRCGVVVNWGVTRVIVPSAASVATWPLASMSGWQVPGQGQDRAAVRHGAPVACPRRRPARRAAISQNISTAGRRDVARGSGALTPGSSTTRRSFPDRTITDSGMPNGFEMWVFDDGLRCVQTLVDLRIVDFQAGDIRLERDTRTALEVQPQRHAAAVGRRIRRGAVGRAARHPSSPRILLGRAASARQGDPVRKIAVRLVRPDGVDCYPAAMARITRTDKRFHHLRISLFPQSSAASAKTSSAPTRPAARSPSRAR